MSANESSVGQQAPSSEQKKDSGPSLTTTVVVGTAVALVEPALLPGMALGVAAVLAPKYFPKLGNALRPFVKGAVRAGVAAASKARELAAEANEEYQDMVAEVRHEQAPRTADTEPAPIVSPEPGSTTPEPKPSQPVETVRH